MCGSPCLPPILGTGLSSENHTSFSLTGILRHHPLDDCMDKYFKDKQSKIPKKYYKKSSGYIFNSWLLTTSEDFRHPELQDTLTTGFPRPVLHGLKWYTKRVLKQMASSPKLLEAFFNVAGINAEPPSFLFHPAAVSKVLMASIGIEKALQDPYEMHPAVEIAEDPDAAPLVRNRQEDGEAESVKK